jgi:hypothetical protein
MRRSFVLFFCTLALTTSALAADFYRWVDKDGQEFFTNDLKQVPQEYRDRVAPVTPDDNRVSVGERMRPERPAAVMEHRDRNGRGEEYWQRRAANIRLKLRDRQDEYGTVLRKMDAQDRKPGKTGSRKNSASTLGSRKAKLEKEIAALQRQLDVDLPEEARKADAYPGWLRE